VVLSGRAPHESADCTVFVTAYRIHDLLRLTIFRSYDRSITLCRPTAHRPGNLTIYKCRGLMIYWAFPRCDREILKS
jgi:hypothetical protein